MPRKSPYVIQLSREERTALEAQTRHYTLPYRDVVRAKIVLLAGQGLNNDEIATRLDTRREIVWKWRKRFYQRRLAGLEELPRQGRPPVFPPEFVVAVKAMARKLPSRLDMPLSRLHMPDIQAEVVARGLVAEILGTTIWRWLYADAVRPWAHRSWIFPRDPHFATKAGRVLDLYARSWQGQPLDEDEFVVSADEKTSIQAHQRLHPTQPAAPGRAARVDTPISATVPSPTWLPGMSIGPTSSGAAKARPASRPSPAWWPRS